MSSGAGNNQHAVAAASLGSGEPEGRVSTGIASTWGINSGETDALSSVSIKLLGSLIFFPY